MKEILLAYKEGKAHAQIAHLVFADTQANTKKPKELFFATAQIRKKYFYKFD